MQAIGRQPQRAPDGAPVHYERHRPEQTTLYRLVQQHATTFFAQAEDAAGADLPQFVKDEFDAFLDCGILAHGFLRLHCADCGHDKLVAFSCKRRGATVIPLVDGPALDEASHRIAPHIVIDAPADCLLMQREIFGPVLPLVAYDRVDEVIARINAGPRPLAIYPFGHDAAVLDRLINHVMSGGVTINDALLHVGQDDLPFGGVGESGMGHYHGHEGFVTFSKLRPIFRQSRWSSLELLMPPYGKLADRVLAFLMR